MSLVKYDTVLELGPNSSNYKNSHFEEADLRRVAQDIEAYYEFGVRTSGSPDNRLTQHRLQDFWRVLVCDRTVDGYQAPADWSNQFAALVHGPSHIPSDVSAHPEFNIAASHGPTRKLFFIPWLLVVFLSPPAATWALAPWMSVPETRL